MLLYNHKVIQSACAIGGGVFKKTGSTKTKLECRVLNPAEMRSIPLKILANTIKANYRHRTALKASPAFWT